MAGKQPLVNITQQHKKAKRAITGSSGIERERPGGGTGQAWEMRRMRMIMMPRRHHGCVSFWPQTGELRKLSRSRRLIPGHGCVSFCPGPVRAHQPEQLQQPMRPRALQPGLHQPAVLPQAQRPGLSLKSVGGLGWHLWTEEREGKTETRAGVKMGTAREATSR
jgi:hypothetical protein